MTTPAHGLADLIAARSVAVIGASSDPARIGGRPVAFLLSSGFAGSIYPVNAKYTEVQGLPCYPDLASIPDRVDAAIVSVPARDVPDVIEDCGRKGVRAAVVFSSGFSEVGDEGRAVQAAIAAAARRTGVRVIGPNCQGLVAVRQHLNLSFSSAFGEWGEPGTVAVVSQSGGIGGMLAMLLRDQGVGFSYWISSGNEADIDVAECIDFFADDPHTRVVAGYVENVGDGARLLDAVTRCREAGKPVVLLRAGRSPQAARAAASHTGAVAAENRVAEALLADAGVIQARDPQELLDAVYGFSRIAAPLGNRVAVLSNSGGLGVIMSDTCAALDLALPELSPSVQQALRQFLPAFGATGNPVDVTAQILADVSLLPRALEVLLRCGEIDLVVVALGMVNRMYPVERIARDIVRVGAEARTPVVIAWVAGAPEGEAALRAAGLAVFTDSTRCLKTLAALVPRARGTVTSASGASRPADTGTTSRELHGILTVSPAGPLDEHASKTVLRHHGIPTVDERLVTTPDEAAAAATTLGYPVAVKICAASIPHKSEHGLVALGLVDAAEVRAAVVDIVRRAGEQFPASRRRGVLVQRMVTGGGTELVVGARRDPTFGPIVMVGLGGVFIEYLDDVALARAPVTSERAWRMLRSLRAFPLLDGARGRAAVDQDAIVDALVRLSHLAVAARERVSEIDVNPLIALPRGHGAVAVDGLLVLS